MAKKLFANKLILQDGYVAANQAWTYLLPRLQLDVDTTHVAQLYLPCYIKKLKSNQLDFRVDWIEYSDESGEYEIYWRSLEVKKKHIYQLETVVRKLNDLYKLIVEKISAKQIDTRLFPRHSIELSHVDKYAHIFTRQMQRLFTTGFCTLATTNDNMQHAVLALKINDVENLQTPSMKRDAKALNSQQLLRLVQFCEKFKSVVKTFGNGSGKAMPIFSLVQLVDLASAVTAINVRLKTNECLLIDRSMPVGNLVSYNALETVLKRELNGNSILASNKRPPKVAIEARSPFLEHLIKSQAMPELENLLWHHRKEGKSNK